MRVVAGLFLAASAVAQNRAPAIESIRREELKADLFFLASDAMRGRLTNTPEYKLAGEWIASRFARLGLLTMAPGDSFRHPFEMAQARLGEANRLKFGTAEASRTARIGEEFYPLDYSANGEVRGRVSLLGFGVRAPEHGWDDYRERDVKGSIVMLFEGDPGAEDPRSPFEGLVASGHADAVAKTLAAQEQGASAVLIISRRADREGPRPFAVIGPSYWPKDPPRVQRYQLASDLDRVRIPALQVSQGLAEHILGSPLDPLRRQADAGGGNVFSTSALPVEIAVSISRTAVMDHNVVARLEGSDAALKNEAIIISAHYDHDGADGPRVFNGADDNGSGTVAVLELAEAYVTAARQGQRPKRSIIFALWGSEERGLLGSRAWVENPLWPLAKTVAALNLDMIGRSEEIPEGGGRRFFGLKTQPASSNANSVHIMGYSFNPELAEMVRQANREIDLTLRMEYDNNRSNLVRRSDQWPFLQNRVPSVFFFTGLHPDYHTTGDRPERIDYVKMERIARLVYQTSWNLAGGDKPPAMPAKRQIPEPQ
jgi:hypothetical protein